MFGITNTFAIAIFHKTLLTVKIFIILYASRNNNILYSESLYIDI